MRRFACVDLGDDKIPDERTILRVRHLLEAHQLTLLSYSPILSRLGVSGSPGAVQVVKRLWVFVKARDRGLAGRNRSLAPRRSRSTVRLSTPVWYQHSQPVDQNKVITNPTPAPAAAPTIRCGMAPTAPTVQSLHW